MEGPGCASPSSWKTWIRKGIGVRTSEDLCSAQEPHHTLYSSWKTRVRKGIRLTSEFACSEFRVPGSVTRCSRSGGRVCKSIRHDKEGTGRRFETSEGRLSTKGPSRRTGSTRGSTTKLEAENGRHTRPLFEDGSGFHEEIQSGQGLAPLSYRQVPVYGNPETFHRRLGTSRLACIERSAGQF